MDGNVKRALVGIAVVAFVVVLFVILSPGDDEGSDTVAPEPVPQDTQRPEPTGESAQSQIERRAPDVPTVVIRDGEPVDGVMSIAASSGETVRFNVQADVAEEVHVHGYDISENVAPGQPARVSFPAELEGVYEVELEHSGTPIVELSVNP